MSDFIKFVTEHWRTVGVVVALLGFFGWDKAKSVISKIKVPTLPSIKTSWVLDNKKLEATDVAAIAHLRNRAVGIKDEALLAEIKSIASKFFDLHCSKNKTDKGLVDANK